ncbi:MULTISPECIES: pilus assembly protein TadG-related protein [Marinobacter]|uniref:Pilus assembly protein TadG-related protein n=1 Tax=Marinobacter shengliensis TaxID=1389223 RepID=A0ABV4W7E9_9GAMM
MNKSRQQGVLIFATPLLLALVFIFVTLLIDGSRLLMMQSQMQSVVNSAATAAADEAQACGGTDVTWNAMQQRALLAAQAAGFDGEASDLEILPGVLRPGETATSPMRFASRNPTTEMAQTNATHVRYTRTEPISFLLPQALFPPITVSADAVARKEVYATLSAAGSTATVEDGLLGMLIGSLLGMPGYSLNATDLSSLENTLIGLGDLLAALGVDNLTDLVDEPLLDVLDAVVTLAGGTVTPAGRVVDDLTGALGLSGLNASAIFEVLAEPPPPQQTTVPVYDFVISLVMNSVRASNQAGSGLLSLDLDTSDSALLNSLVGSESLLADVDVALGLWVNEPPKIVIGPARQDSDGQWMTKVSAADIGLDARIEVDLSSGLIGTVTTLLNVLTLGSLDVKLLTDDDGGIRIPLVVKVGGGEAFFEGADCAKGDSNTTRFDFRVEGGAVSAESGALNPANGQIVPEPIYAPILDVEAKFLGVVTLVDMEVCLSADADVDIGSSAKYETLAPYNLSCPGGVCEIGEIKSTGGLDSINVEVNNVSLLKCSGSTSSNEQNVIDTLIGGLVSPLTSLLSVVLEEVVTTLVSPLLSALGADLGGMHLRVLGAEQTGSQLVENVVFEE